MIIYVFCLYFVRKLCAFKIFLFYWVEIYTTLELKQYPWYF